MRDLPRFPFALFAPALAIALYTDFGSLAMLPVIAAVWVASKRLPRRWVWVWALGTLAILIKHITLFQVWAVFVLAFGFRRALLAMLATGAIFLASFLPYRDAIEQIIPQVFGHAGGYAFGLHWILPANVAQLAFFAGMLAMPILARYVFHMRLERGMALAGWANVALIYNVWMPHLLFPVWFAPNVLYALLVIAAMLIDFTGSEWAYPLLVLIWGIAAIHTVLPLKRSANR